MEVASPLSFSHKAGAKRHLPCSPGFVDATARNPFGLESNSAEEYVNQRFKRRRFNVDEKMDDSENSTSHISPFAFQPSQKNVFSSVNNGESLPLSTLLETIFSGIAHDLVPLCRFSVT